MFQDNGFICESGTPVNKTTRDFRRSPAAGAFGPGDSVGPFVLAPGAERFGFEIDDPTIERNKVSRLRIEDRGKESGAAELGVLIFTNRILAPVIVVALRKLPRR